MNSEGEENKMFGFKTEEEKAKLADYDRLLAENKDLLAHDKAMEENRNEWMDYAKAIEAKLEAVETELIIRRKNDEFRQKLTVAK